jgi:hypothetical protein
VGILPKRAAGRRIYKIDSQLLNRMLNYFEQKDCCFTELGLYGIMAAKRPLYSFMARRLAAEAATGGYA